MSTQTISDVFIKDNPNNLYTCLEIHGMHTRSINQHFLRIQNFKFVEKQLYILV
jgi:hypothetical protein